MSIPYFLLLQAGRLARRPARWIALALLLLALFPLLAPAQTAPCAPSYAGVQNTGGLDLYVRHQQSFTATCTGKLTTLVVTYNGGTDDLRNSGFFVQWRITDAAGTTTLATVPPTDDIFPNATKSYDFSAANVVLTAGQQYRWEALETTNAVELYLLPLVSGDPYSGGRAFANATTGSGPAATATQDFRGWTVNIAALSTPALTSLSPTSGPVGTSVTLTGSNLSGATQVTFAGTANNTVTTGLTVSGTGSSQTLTVAVPSGAATGNVTVTTPGGTSNGVSFTVTVPATTATVTTAAATSITATSATLGGNVTTDGGATITERGVVYVAGSGTPTTANTKLTAAGTTGSYTVSATGLTAGTLYTVRAYAINSAGTSYGAAQSFTTTAGAVALTISTGTAAAPVNIPAGTYTTITVTSTGYGRLGGNVVVNTSLTVDGGLDPDCRSLTGPGSFTLNAGGTLVICDDNGIAATGNTGTVRVSALRSFSDDASYVYSGANGFSQATGSGLPATVRRLEVTAGVLLDLSQPVSIRRELRLTTGQLFLNGRALTLLSDATGTALVVNSGGTVFGNATVQRYIDGSLNAGAGYRHFSAPVTNTTVADLGTTTGFTPEVSQASAYNSSATPGTTTPFPTVFGYDQARLVTAANSNYSAFDKGFFVPAGLTAPLTPGQGYAVNIAGNQLVDFVGTLGDGNRTRSLARNSGPTAADAGWQLVGNPYPAPLDWSLVAPADRANLDGSMYVVQSTGPYAGGYRSYVNGQSTSGTNNPLIASSQGFWVRVSAGQTAGSLTFRNAQRVTDYAAQQVFQRGTADLRPALRLALAGNGLADAWVAYAEAGATVALDAQFDAAKLPNTTGLNLSSEAGPDNLAIDGQAAFTAATVLPLAVGVPAAGAYTLALAELRNLPAGLSAYLRDAQTGALTALAPGTSYAFAVANAQALVRGRFAVVFRSSSPLAATSAALAAQVGLYPNPARAFATLDVPGVAGASQVQVQVLNALGQVVLRQQAALPASGTSLTLPTGALATGVYAVRLTLGQTTLIKRLAVE